jgi:hypothetical protein
MSTYPHADLSAFSWSCWHVTAGKEHGSKYSAYWMPVSEYLEKVGGADKQAEVCRGGGQGRPCLCVSWGWGNTPELRLVRLNSCQHNTLQTRTNTTW